MELSDMNYAVTGLAEINEDNSVPRNVRAQIQGILETLMTGNLRFVGAMLLHVLSSAVIGVALALSFYKSRRSKRLYALYGVILASLLHGLFNFLILNTAEEYLLRTFGLVWLGLIVLLAVLEYIKRIHPVVVRHFSK